MTFQQSVAHYLLLAVLRSFQVALCRKSLLARRRRILGSGPAFKRQATVIAKECKRWRSTRSTRSPSLRPIGSDANDAAADLPSPDDDHPELVSKLGQMTPIASR